MTDIDTALGRLHIAVDGEGPPAVLWHSLFVDSGTWAPLSAVLRRRRRLILIDGPGHGQSSAPTRDFTLDDCVDAAVRVLDALGVDGPADWLGNAWGGHVGLTLAASRPELLRSLTTIATPVPALSRRERRSIVPMVAIYRVVGPVGPLVNALAVALLGKRFVRERPAETAAVMGAFRAAPKSGMHRAMVSAMLRRPGLEPLSARVRTPTVMVVPTGDPLLTVEQTRSAAAQMPCAAAVTVEGEGHVAPLFAQADELASIIEGFWADPVKYVEGQR